MTSTCVSAASSCLLADRDVLEDASLRRTRLVYALVSGEARWSPTGSLSRPLLAGVVIAALGLAVYAAVVFAQGQLRSEASNDAGRATPSVLSLPTFLPAVPAAGVRVTATSAPQFSGRGQIPGGPAQ